MREKYFDYENCEMEKKERNVNTKNIREVLVKENTIYKLVNKNTQFFYNIHTFYILLRFHFMNFCIICIYTTVQKFGIT